MSRVVKLMSPDEARANNWQRHQHQVAAALTAAAAVPAFRGLRAGTAASRAMAAGDKGLHEIKSGLQMRHSATGIALGGLAGAANALPTPKRLLSRNPKRTLKPAKLGGNKHVYRAAAPTAPGYTHHGIGKSHLTPSKVEEPTMIDAFGVSRPDLAVDKADYNPKKTLRAQGMAINPGGRMPVVRDTRLNTRIVRSGPSTQANRRTYGRAFGRGALAGGAVGAATGAAIGAHDTHKPIGALGGALAGGGSGAMVGGGFGGQVGSLQVGRRANRGAIARGIQAGHISTGVPKSQISRLTQARKTSASKAFTGAAPFPAVSKAYAPGSITVHQTQADLHGRKKSAAGRRIAPALSAGVAGAALGGAAVRQAPTIAAHLVPPASKIGARAFNQHSALMAPKVARAGKIGGLAALGAGGAVAGGSVAQRAFHGHQQNKQTKLAQTARRQRNSTLVKNDTGAEVFARGGVELELVSVRTVDGVAEQDFGPFGEQHMIRQGVAKDYFYGATPRHQKQHEVTPGAAAFGGAAAGALLPKLGAKLAPKTRRMLPKIRAAGAALKTA